MARIETITRVSDLDGSPADETVTIAVNGKRAIEIDLSASQASDLRAVLAPYLNAGRPTSNGQGAKARRSSRNGTGNSVVREWARNNGFPELANRGRIPANVTEAYVAAHTS